MPCENFQGFGNGLKMISSSELHVRDRGWVSMGELERWPFRWLRSVLSLGSFAECGPWNSSLPRRGGWCANRGINAVSDISDAFASPENSSARPRGSTVACPFTISVLITCRAVAEFSRVLSAYPYSFAKYDSRYPDFPHGSAKERRRTDREEPAALQINL